MVIDTVMPTLEEVIARSTAPAAHANNVIVSVGVLVYWKARTDLDGTEGVTFFDGDYRDVLEPNDPRILAALAKA